MMEPGVPTRPDPGSPETRGGSRSGAAKAAKAEAQNVGHHIIEDRGVTFRLEASTDALPVDAIEALEDGKLVPFIREMVGAEKFAEWKRTFAPNRARMKDLEPLSRKLAEPYGFLDAGESSASSGS